VAIIGDNTTLREYVTVNRGTASKNKTVVGNNCLIMAYCHIAHDCLVGNNVIMSNATQLAGEVVIDDFAILSGAVLVHQFVHIGAHVMIQGGSRINKDVPPYVLAGHDPLSYAGVNLAGLRRRSFTDKQINTIQSIYRLIYLSDMNTSHAIEQVLEKFSKSDERDNILNFICNSSRGIISGCWRRKRNTNI
jgi:UDP-N-acetylglucosamine acyltransferase